jgi:predicted kinase
LEFVLQFVAGDEGVAVGFCKFDNVIKVVHNRIRQRRDDADSTTDLILFTHDPFG